MQALLTFVVFLYSVRSTKRTFKEDQKRTLSVFKHERNLERERQARETAKDEAQRYKSYEEKLSYISISLGFISGALKVVKKRALDQESYSVGIFEYSIRNLRHSEEDLRNILGESLPTRETISRVRTAIIYIHSAITYIDASKENPGQKLSDALDGVIQEIEKITQQNDRLMWRVRMVIRRLKIESAQ